MRRRKAPGKEPPERSAHGMDAEVWIGIDMLAFVTCPYIADDEVTIGDSDAIIAHVINKYRLTIDATLTQSQRATDLMIRRTLDDLYWVMSYSR
jgi:hypothetical protein